MRRYLWCGIVLAALAVGSRAPLASDLRAQAGCAMRRAAAFVASIATNGGYVGIYSLDLGERYGESLSQRAGRDEIWVQPPGTPSVGACFLRAYRITGDLFYRETALKAGLALAWGQDGNGGWPYLAEVGDMPPDPAGGSPSPRRGSETTLDDGTTQAALSFLIDLDGVADAPWLTEAIRSGLRYMRMSQGPAGGWPQVYPARGTYADAYTFNDGVTNAAVKVMLQAHRAYGSADLLASARRAGDFILKSQLPEPQPGWAQQYDRRDLRPAPARAFEPAAIDSAITAGNVATLIELYAETGETRFLQPIPAAVAWLERSAIAPDRWARFYEIGTNRPMYPARNGSIHYELRELSDTDQEKYAYQGTFGIPRVIRTSRKLMAEEAGDVGGRLEQNRRRAAAERAERVLPGLISGLDPQGRWVQDGRIRMRTFVNNCNTILDYLEYAKPGMGDP
jgi:PelA/Pel-15E family pectate lyase